MRVLFALILGVIFSSCAATQTAPPVPPTFSGVVKIATHDFNCFGLNDIHEIQKCLVYMATQGNGDPGGPAQGSAFWVSEHYIVTAAHVALYASVDPDARLILSERHPVTDRVLSYTKVEVERWIFPFLGEDFAIGYVADPPAHETVSLCSVLFEGEMVTAHGYPGDAGYEQATGHAFGLYKDWVLSTNKVRGGFSGGPLIADQRACALGVISKTNGTTTMSVSFKILSKFILELDAATQLPKTSR